MYKVGFPSKNKITGGYSSAHNGYDIDAEPDTNIYCPLHDAKVVIAKNSETRQWIANSKTDPYKNDARRPDLITEDYGNYVKLKGKDNAGVECYYLVAHLQPGSAPKVGSTFKQGDVIGKAGLTGNTTGTHSHSEFRTLKDIKQPVAFESPAIQPKPEPTNPVLDDQQRAVELFKAYRAIRKQGPEGNWEGYANALIGHDRDFPNLEADLRSAQTTISEHHSQFGVLNDTNQALARQLKQAQEDLTECQTTVVEPVVVEDPNWSLKKVSAHDLLSELVNRMLGRGGESNGSNQ